jgi:hypothetical protein
MAWQSWCSSTHRVLRVLRGEMTIVFFVPFVVRSIVFVAPVVVQPIVLFVPFVVDASSCSSWLTASVVASSL